MDYSILRLLDKQSRTQGKTKGQHYHGAGLWRFPADNGKTTLPTKAWKTEYAKLTAERNGLNQRYVYLKDEVKEAEQIRRSVYSILRQERREQQPRKTQDMEL